MIFLKTEEEIQGMKLAGDLLAKTHLALKKIIKPGITTLELDDFVEAFLKKHGATPEQKGYTRTCRCIETGQLALVVELPAKMPF